MGSKRKSGVLVFVVTFATATLLATSAISATLELTTTQPQVEATAPATHSEIKTTPASEQKNPEKPENNGKKKGRFTGMLLTLFAVITGHQGTTR
jgi:hypothetical protein